MDAKTANELFTRALHLPPNESNLGDFIAEVGKNR
jgi:hypothetical protein